MFPVITSGSGIRINPVVKSAITAGEISVVVAPVSVNNSNLDAMNQTVDLADTIPVTVTSLTYQPLVT
jgi:uncharacterized Fe-S cluster-containing radical SAM superfamily enzyme